MVSRKLYRTLGFAAITLMALAILATACGQGAMTATPTAKAPTAAPTTTAAAPAPTTAKPATSAPATASTQAPAAAGKVFKWNFQTVSPGELEVNAWKNWAQRIKAGTSGQVDITVLPAGAICSPTEAWNAIPKGVLEISRTSFGYATGKLPEAYLFHEIPGALKTVDEYLSLYRDYGWLDKGRSIFNELGVFLVAPNPGGGKPFWAKKPITTVADVKGLKIRTLALIGDLFTYMGASTSMIPHEESYTALQLGTVQAYSSSVGTVYIDLKHYELCPYIMLPSLSSSGSCGIIANPAAWNSLPDNLKAIVQTATDYMAWESFAGGDASVDWFESMRLINQVQAKGNKIEFVTMSKELQDKITEAGTAILDKIAAKNQRTAALAADMKSVMKIKGYIK